MKVQEVTISPEYSAQPTTASPNPMVLEGLEYLEGVSGPVRDRRGRIADQGCGRLRHARLLLGYASELYLVDTPLQLDRQQTLAGKPRTVRQYAAQIPPRSKPRQVLAVEEFAQAGLRLDLVVCAALYDVVPPGTREDVARHAARNLNDAGHYLVVVPRNDSSILRRCDRNNEWEDGHVFQHHGVRTFYRNFRDHDELIELGDQAGLTLVEDLSVYRQVCLVLSKGR